MRCYNQTPWHLRKWYLQQNGGKQEGKMPMHPKRMCCWNEETMALKMQQTAGRNLHVSKEDALLGLKTMTQSWGQS
jgi:hypothetical protein